MSGIFFSYRRFITGGYAGHLRTSLGEIYRDDQISMDIEIEPGEDFERWIKQQVESCHVLLAILGRGWATVTDDDGNLRLQDPHDYARIELEEGLQRGVPIIPVLVGDARMPTAPELPPSIAPLCRLHAIEISDERWKFDTERLIRAIDRQTAGRIPKIAPILQAAPIGRFPADPPLPPVDPDGRIEIAFDPEPDPVTGGTATKPRQPTVIDVDEPEPVHMDITPDPGSSKSQRTDNSRTGSVEKPARDRAKPFVTWGWILGTIGALIIPFLALVAIVFGALVIARSDGRRTGTGVMIIVVAIFAGAIGYGIALALWGY